MADAALFTLPVKSSNPSFAFQTDLDGTTYTLSFTWNERVEAWFASIADTNETPIVCGARVVAGGALFARTTNDALPKGVIFVVDTSRQDLDPGLDDLGSRVQVRYLSFGDS